MPAVLFSDQLVDAYPNAKVILTESDPDTFVKSMKKSYYNIINDRSTGFIAMFDSVSNTVRKWIACEVITTRIGLQEEPHPTPPLRPPSLDQER